MTLGLYIRYKIRLRKIYAKLARESQKYKIRILQDSNITISKNNYVLYCSMGDIVGRGAVIVFKNFLVRREKSISLWESAFSLLRQKYILEIKI